MTFRSRVVCVRIHGQHEGPRRAHIEQVENIFQNQMSSRAVCTAEVIVEVHKSSLVRVEMEQGSHGSLLVSIV